MNGFDPEIVREFLAESLEQVERLDRDLLALEQAPSDPELINRVFRAFHTIKGSAAFLAITALVEAAHAAETALAAARSGKFVLDRPTLDSLLAAVDAIKKQLADLRDGGEPAPADSDLLARLCAAGHAPVFTPPDPVEVSDCAQPTGAPEPTPAPVSDANIELVEPPAVPPAAQTAIEPHAAQAAEQTAPEFVPPDAPTAQNTDAAALPAEPVAPPARRPLTLPDNKATLVEFLVQDLRDTLGQAEAAIAAIADPERRTGGWNTLGELAEALHKTAIFFEFPVMARLCESVVAAAGPTVTDRALDQVLPRLLAAVWLLREQADGLARSEVIERPVDALCCTLRDLGTEGCCATVLPFGSSAADALAADRVIPAAQEAPDAQTLIIISGAPSISDPGAALQAPPEARRETADDAASQADRANEAQPVIEAPEASPVGAPMPAAPAPARAAPHAADATIRVEVGRLETLLNLVGELVLQKNRLGAMAHRAAIERFGSHEFHEAFTEAADNLERVTDDIQLAVMRTRMQPLGKLFGKYPRLVRDLARKMNKDIRLAVEGGETEVDRSVIEELADPLMHLLRNSADHGIETPEERTALGKDPCGTITLAARHAGGAIEVSLADDGRGFSRARIARRGVELGLVSEPEIARMQDREVFALAFAPGFSTADSVTEVSGRGVGMDVVRTNIERVNGTIHLASTEGRGTTITIKIPLTVAIMDAMMVRIGREIFALPVSSVLEIVKPEPRERCTIYGLPVLRLRDTIIPVLSGLEVFGVPRHDTPDRVIIILAGADGHVGVEVGAVLGQQEVVVKRLDSGPGQAHAAAPVSGATVRHDGGVSLIVDVPRTLELGRRLFAQRNASDNRRKFNQALGFVPACAA